MLGLIVKDLMLIGKINIFMIIFAFFIAVMGTQVPALAGIMYVFAVFIVAYFGILYCTGYDDKCHSELAINSFPVNRRTVVAEKYLLIIILTGVLWAVISMITNLMPVLGLKISSRTCSLWDLVFTLNIVTLFFSIYYPFYFMYDSIKMKTVNSCLYLVIVLIPPFISKFLKSDAGINFVSKYAFTSINVKSLSIILAFAAVVIFIISMLISIKIYKGKDF